MYVPSAERQIGHVREDRLNAEVRMLPFSPGWYQSARETSGALAGMEAHLANSPTANHWDDVDEQIPIAMWDALFEELAAISSPRALAFQINLYRLMTLVFGRPSSPLDRSPTIARLRLQWISRLLQSDLEPLRDSVRELKASDFEAWYRAKCTVAVGRPHPLFEHLAQSADLAEYSRYVREEAAVHISFDDVMAFTMIGLDGRVKVEVADNLRDEIGSGDPSAFHTTLFGRLVSELGLTSPNITELLPEALICANYMMVLCSTRDLAPLNIGYLGFLEALSPCRFSGVYKGGRRLGLSIEALTYHHDHSELDQDHAEHWLANVMLPLIEAKPARAETVALGVLLREKVSNRYWDALAKRIRAL